MNSWKHYQHVANKSGDSSQKQFSQSVFVCYCVQMAQISKYYYFRIQQHRDLLQNKLTNQYPNWLESHPG